MRAIRVLCLVAVALFVASPPLPAAQPAPAATDSPRAAEVATSGVAEVVPLEELFDDAPATDAPAAEDPLFLDSWSCPAFTQICSTDAQCDGYCGGAGLGACISFGGARKCCACTA